MKKEIIDKAVLEVAEVYGNNFTRREYTKYSQPNNLPSWVALKNEYGSFNEAKKNVLGKDSINKKRLHEDDFKKAFSLAKKEYGLHFTQAQYKEMTIGTEHPSVATIHNQYGSFNLAKKKLLGKRSVNFWGNTIKSNHNNFEGLDMRILNRRMKIYKELDLSDMEIRKNMENYEKDKEFAEFCIDCRYIKGCNQNKNRCKHYSERID